MNNTIFPQKFLVFDVESYGLHGPAFAVAGVLLDRDTGEITNHFAWHVDRWDVCTRPPSVTTEDLEWVRANVSVPDISEALPHSSFMRERFWSHYLLLKESFSSFGVAVECGWPVEARFLNQCITDDKQERNWLGPYPMWEIASIMASAGMDPMAARPRFDHLNETPEHDPLADSYQSARLLYAAIQEINNPTA